MAIHATSADALLSYSLATAPTDPLNASTDKDPVVGRLDITVGRNMTTPAYCRKIIVKIPIGAGAAELTTVNSDDIKQSVIGGTPPDQGGGWTASAVAEGNKRVFTFTPGRAPQFTGQWAVTLVISQIPINKVVGKPVIEVIEETSPTNTDYTAKDPVRITVDKAPPGFVFRNLRPSKIMVENGDPVTLTWEIQNGTCVMYWDDQSDPNVNSEPRWVSPPLHNTTGFMLQATSAEDASFVHTLTTAVTVAKPDLDTGHLNVYGNATTHDGLAVRHGLSLDGVSSLITRQVLNFFSPGDRWVQTTANSDGILVVRVLSGALAVRVSGVSYDLDAAPGTIAQNWRCATIPVLRGETVSLKWTRQTAHVQNLIWYPFGGGLLPEPS